MLLLYIQQGLIHPAAVDSSEIHGNIQNDFGICITVFNIAQKGKNVYTRKI
tara:strand:+ start:1029 stop:1181 length:153 start_codon:yes stop_codon:yes gene_type:complete